MSYFNENAYLLENPDVKQAIDSGSWTGSAADHYKQYGMNEGRSLGGGLGAFNADAYLKSNQDVADAGVDPMQHFLQYGINENRNLGIGPTTQPTFSPWQPPAGYTYGPTDNLIPVSESPKTETTPTFSPWRPPAGYTYDPTDNLIPVSGSPKTETTPTFSPWRPPAGYTYGPTDNLIPVPGDIAGIKNTPAANPYMTTFDEAGYLLSNPDVAAAIAAGAFSNGQEHYKKYGAAEGRVLSGTSGVFDPVKYLSANPDVANAGVNPLKHYLDYGMSENRELYRPLPPRWMK